MTICFPLWTILAASSTTHYSEGQLEGICARWEAAEKWKHIAYSLWSLVCLIAILLLWLSTTPGESRTLILLRTGQHIKEVWRNQNCGPPQFMHDLFCQPFLDTLTIRKHSLTSHYPRFRNKVYEILRYTSCENRTRPILPTAPKSRTIKPHGNTDENQSIV